MDEKPANYSQRPIAILLGLWLLAIYLDMAVFIGPLKVPSLLSLPLIAYCLRYIQNWLKILSVSFAILFFSMIPIILGPASVPLEKIVNSIVLIIFSTTTAQIIIATFKTSNAQVFSRVAALATTFIIGIVITEWIGLTDGLVSNMSAKIYSNNIGFDYYGIGDHALERDTYMFGWRRPTAFSPEPSIVVIFLGTLITILGITSRYRFKHFITFALISFTFYIYRSPIALFPAPIIFINESLNGRLKISFPIQLLVFGILLTVMSGLVSPRFEGRVETLEAIVNSSEGQRLIYPFIVNYWSIAEGNFLGIGPGGVYDPVFFMRLSDNLSPRFGTNAVGLLFIYFGPIGAAFLTFIAWKSFRIGFENKREGIFALASFLCFGFALGALESAQLFGFWALVYCSFVASRRHAVAS